MALKWSLKRTMVLRKGLYRPSDLKGALAERNGFSLSLTSVCALIKKDPEVLKVSTIQAICNTLNCRLSDFCDIEPDEFAESNPELAGTDPRQSDAGSRISDDIKFPDLLCFTADDDD